MLRNFRAAATPLAPMYGGAYPRMRPPILLPFVLCLLGSTVACSSGSADQVTQPVALGMTNTIGAYYDDGNLTMYEVQTPVPLPVRRPTDSERQSLGPAPHGTPYSHAPFLLADDESLEVHYVISNVDGDQHTVWLLIDPWNEFVRWRPGVTVVDEDVTIPNFSGYEKAFPIGGKQRIEGTLTSDDMREVSIKLAAVEKVLAAAAAANPATSAAPTQGQPAQPPMPQTIGNCGLDATTLSNNIFNTQNRSNSGDPCFNPWIPPVIAGLTGFDLGLRTMNEQANVAVEITIDVVDLNGNRFVAQDTTSPQLGMPKVFLSPPGARF